LLVLALASSADSLSTSGSSRLNVNPIRRVVTMLQSMQKKVEAEGKKEDELFDKFMCYCKNGVGALEASIEAAVAKNEQLIADIKETDSNSSRQRPISSLHKKAALRPRQQSPRQLL